ncbi:MAG TPA: AbrB/MazE/SpoVT family DNA-binding domain-containing protein [Terrimicrobiaceae bacterium]|nr:AbrB/MazE/SpoVT family DNA-binding domain-containing protein [Terrimicrobiaceae bacterium]
MATIKLTAKRQATLPVEVCKALGITRGDSLELLPLLYKNEKVWALKPVVKAKSSWVGSLSRYAAQAKRPWTREEHGDLTGRAMSAESGK